METKTEIPTETFAKKLIDALIDFYEPCNTPAEADEAKSTQELIEEMNQTEDLISMTEVNLLMKEHGFLLHYNGSGYEWLLKNRTSEPLIKLIK